MRNLNIALFFLLITPLCFADGLSINFPFVPLNSEPIITPGFGGHIDTYGVADPEILWDGKLVRIYYTATGLDGVSRIALATSQDLKTWESKGVVWEPENGKSFNRSGVFGPSVEYVNNRFELFYTAENNGFHVIGKAISDDGYFFTQSEKPVLSGSFNEDEFDMLGVGHPSVLTYNGIKIMMYQGYDNSFYSHLGLAYSLDGTSFVKVPGYEDKGSNLGRGPHGFDDGGALAPEIVYADGEFRLFYTSLHF